MKPVAPGPHGWLVGMLACALSVALSAPLLRNLIEQSMVWHMVVQMPMLVLGGWLVMGLAPRTRVPSRLAAWNRLGLSGFIAALAISAYWMLPVSIDRAVVVPMVDLAKIVTLMACGALLRDSIDRAPAVLQLFFIGYAVPMMVWLGIYFVSTDLRLCNAYSLESQARAGQGLMALGLALGLLFARHFYKSMQTSVEPRAAADG